MSKQFIILCILAILSVAAQQDQCSGYTSCGSCTPVGGCGWCTYSGTCEAGNATGSYVGCTGTWWIWAETYCPVTPAPTVNCAALAASCDSCTYLGGCGWCSFTNTCEAGNNTGSFEGCVAPYWSWTSNQCATPAPAVVCSAYTDCGSCTPQTGCGWCSFTNACEPGNYSGSALGCVPPYWSWNTCPTVTPTPAAQCSLSTSCNSCTSLGGCGWCSFTGACEPGNASGSVFGCVPPNWSWVNNQCPAPPPVPTPVNNCGGFDNNCQSCSEVANCGFCLSSGLCEVGNTTGSLSGDCSGTNWAWSINLCPASNRT